MPTLMREDAVQPNLYHRRINGCMMPDPERYQYRQPGPGEDDVDDLLCVGRRLKESFGPGHCYGTDGVVAGLRKHDERFPEGVFTVWTVRVHPWWRVERWASEGLPARLPKTGHKNSVVAEGGRLHKVYAHDDSRFCVLEMAPPAITERLRIEERLRREKQAQMSLFPA